MALSDMDYELEHLELVLVTEELTNDEKIKLLLDKIQILIEQNQK